MRIAFIGNFTVPYTTENDWVWTYEHLGHEVVKLQENRVTTEQIEDVVLNQDIDLVHYVHTHGWKTPGKKTLFQLWKLFKEKGIPTISVHLDTWYGLKRSKDVNLKDNPFWATEYVFTADGGADEWYKSLGINHFYLPAGVVERDCKLGNYRRKYDYDVVFVGAKKYHEEWPYRTKLIEWLETSYQNRFARFSWDSPKGIVRGQDLNDLYASAKVVVGDTLCLGYDHKDYFSDRLFETVGRGGFLIFPEIPGLENVFQLDWSYSHLDRGSFVSDSPAELTTYKFNDFNDLKTKIEAAIVDNKTRDLVRKAGFERVKKDHTYTNRAETVLEIVGLA